MLLKNLLALAGMITLVLSGFALAGTPRDQILHPNEEPARLIEGGPSKRTEPKVSPSRSQRLFDYDRSNLIGFNQSEDIEEQGICRGDDCTIRSTFLAGADRGAIRIGDVAIERDLSFPGRRQITIRWEVAAPGATKGLPPGQKPEGFQVLVIEDVRYRVFNVSEQIVASQPVRSRGRGQSNDQGARQEQRSGRAGQEPARPLQDLLEPARELTFNALPGQNVEIFVRPVSKDSEKDARKPLPKGLGISYATVQATDSSPQATVVQQSEKGGTPVGRITFTDAALEQCVRAAVGKNPRYPAHKLTALTCHDAGISLIDGLEYFVGLQVLDLSNNRISDLTPLSSLTNLTSLNLSNNGPETSNRYQAFLGLDLAPISSLTSLHYVHIDENDVRSISEITTLTQLDTLTVAGAHIRYVPDFSATSLRVADFSDNPVADIDGLAQVLTLETIDLSGSKLGDLTPLITNANQSGNQLAEVDIRTGASLSCTQISALESALSSGLLQFTSGDCVGEAPPSGLLSSANPSNGFDFTVSWQATGAPSTAEYDIKAVHPLDPPGTDYVSTPDTTFDFSARPQGRLGSYLIQVRMCETDSGGCSGWSKGIEQIVLADASEGFDTALARVRDAELAQCISEHKTGKMTEAGHLTSLTCENRGIADLSGLERFPGLSELDLSDNSINTLQPLSLLASLTDVNLSGNTLAATQLGHLSSVQTDFIRIDLSRTPISDLTGLDALQSVGTLDVSMTSVSDLSPISSVSVSELRASMTQVSAIPPLTGTIQVNVRNASVSDLSGLYSVASTLEVLELSGNPIAWSVANENTLSQLHQLREVYLGYSELTDPGFSSSWPHLSRLSLEGNSIASTAGLSDLSALKYLDVDHTDLSSVAFAASMPSLETLSAKYTNIDDLTPLSGATSLRFLKINGGDLSSANSLSPLSGSHALERLEFSNTGVTDVMPLVSLAQHSGSSLQSVDLVGEPNVACSQVNALWQEGVLADVGNGSAQCVAGQPQLLNVLLESDMETYEVRWDAPDAPPGFYALGETQVEYDFGVTSGSVMVESGQESVRIEQPPSSSTHYQFRVSHCAHPNDCTQPTSWAYADYPMQRPIDTLGGLSADGSAALEWSYPDLPPADQSPIEFRIEALFSAVPPQTITWGSDAQPWSTVLADPTLYPGRAVNVHACLAGSNGEDCSPPAYVSFREIAEDPIGGPLPAPSWATLERQGGSEFGYRLIWEESQDEKVDFYRVEELRVENGQANALGRAHIALRPEIELRRYVPRQGAEMAFRVSACSDEAADGERCSDTVSSNSLDTNPSSLRLRRVANLCWENMQLHAFGSRLVTLRWTYPNGHVMGTDTDPPAKFISYVIDGPNSETDNSNVQHLYGDARYQPSTDTWFYESKPVWVGLDTTLTLKGRAGNRFGLGRSIQPIDSGGYQDHSARCDNFEVYSEEETIRSAGSPGLLSAGHWTSAPQKEKDGDEMVVRGVQTGWQFFWSNDLASPGPVPTDREKRFDLLGIWFAYEDRAEGDSEDWAPVWYYSKLTVQVEDGEPTFATGDILRPEKEGLDQVVGNMDVRFSSLPDGSGETPSSREAWLSVRMGDDSGNRTFDEGELLAVQDVLLDSLIIDPDWFYDNPQDHFRGIWAEDGALFSAEDGSIIEGANHILTEWIVGDMLSWAVLGFDDPEDAENGEEVRAANPMWLISFKCANGDYSEDCGADTFDELQHQAKSQFNTVYPGHPPFGETLVEDRENGRTPSNFVEAGWGYGVSRYYKGTDELNVPLDHNTLKSCIDLHGSLSSTAPTYTYNFSFGGGNCSALTLPSGNMSKVANRHHIDFTIGGSYDERFCQMPVGMETCEIELEWSTDDDFGQYAGPSVVPMVTRQGESIPVDLDRICENVDDSVLSYSSTGVTCGVTEPGEYRLRLVSRPEQGSNPETGENEWQWADGAGTSGAQSSVIATSDLLHVSGPIPSEPEIAPVGPAQPPAEDPAFFCPDGSSDCSGSDIAQEVLASSEVGGTQGDFRVTESGAAEYTIPIMTAKGVAGVEPEVALQHNSQRTDDGPMGRGWNVSGLSAINRCGQTPEVDGKSTGVTLTNTDRFCLDGQRLILIGAGDYGADGTEYRLEVDNLTKVKAHSRTGVNGIAYFEVLRSDGSRSLYGYDPSTVGSSPSAEVLAPVQDKPFAWPISRFSDNLGNYIQFEYAQPSVGEAGHEELIQWLPKAIRYTGFDGAAREEAPFARIEFTYEYRSPSGRPKRLLEGNELYSTRLLEKVTSYSDGLILRVYRPDYETDAVSGADLMQSITECYSNRSDPTQDAGINCLPRAQFNWTLPGSHWASYGEAPGVPEQFGLIPNFRGASAADFDGDEREEFLYVRAGHENRATFVLGKNATAQGEDALDLDLASNFIAVCNAKYSDLGGWLTADITGNGRAELVYVVKHCRESHPNGPGIYYHTWDSQSGGLSEQATHLATLPSDSQYSTSENNRLNVADVNGDGRLDLTLSMVETYSGQNPKIWYYRNDTVGPSANFFGPYDVGADISGAFEGGGICGPECEYQYSLEIFDSPVAAVDQSGAAGLLARATRRASGTIEQQDINAVQQTTGREFVTKSELLNILSSGSGADDTSVDKASFVWSLGSASSSEYSLSPKLKINEITSSLSDDTVIKPLDYNSDGYTDFLKVSKNGPDVQFSLLVHPGITSDPTGGDQIPSARLSFSFVKEMLFSSAKKTLVYDSNGNSMPEVHLLESLGSSLHYYKRYEWPWVDAPYSGSEAALIGGQSTYQLGLNNQLSDCNDQMIPIDFFGNGQMGVFHAVNESLDDSDCDSEYYITAVQGKSSLQSEDLPPSEERYIGGLMINEIVDGLGVSTVINHSVTGDRTTYTREMVNGGSAELEDGKVTVPPAAPIPLVKSVETTVDAYDENGQPLAGQEASMSRIRYAYSGARIQAGGRGFLGFAQLITYDEQSGVLTATRYRQDFPLIGRPRGTMRWKVPQNPWAVADAEVNLPLWNKSACSNDQGPQSGYPALLGCSFTEWNVVSSALGGPIPYSELKTEYHWAANVDTAGVVTGSQFTYRDKITQSVDSYGNLVLSTTEKFLEGAEESSEWVYRQVVDSDFADAPATGDAWLLGRLECTDVETSRRRDDGQGGTTMVGPVTRTTRYGYAPGTGLLDYEAVETGLCSDPSDPHKETTYQHDDFGNVEQTDVTPSVGQVRASRRQFASIDSQGSGASRGRYLLEESVYSAEDGLWYVTKHVNARDRYGNARSVLDPQGQQTRNYYDLLGRPYYSYNSDGSWEKLVNVACRAGGGGTGEVACSLQDTTVMCPEGSALAHVSSAADGNGSYTCKDVLGREVRSASKVYSEIADSGFRWSYQDQRYDHASRPVWVTQPYLAGDDVYWNSTIYDQVGRLLKTWRDTNSTSDGDTDPDSDGDASPSLVKKRQYDGMRTTTTVVVADDQIDPQVSLKVRNAMGETVEETVAVGTALEATTFYEFNAIGDLAQVTAPVGDPNGVISSASVLIEYDTFGNKIGLSDPDKGDWTYAFNGHADLVCQFDELSRGVVNTYDSLGRLVRRRDVVGSGSPPNGDDCLLWVASDGSVQIPGDFEVTSETVWVFGAQQPSFNGLPAGAAPDTSSISEPFGRVLSDHVVYGGEGEEIEIQVEYAYDHQARLRGKTTEVCQGDCTIASDVRTFEERTTYDRIGRVFQQFDASSEFFESSPYDSAGGSNEGGRGQQFVYSDVGHLWKIREATHHTLGSVYWRLQEMDARGKAIHSWYGNGMELRDTFNPETGELVFRLQEHSTQHGYAVGQMLALTWDSLGRLKEKEQLSLATVAQAEIYIYDERNRLEYVYRTDDPAEGADDWEQSLYMEYGISGNILYKSDVQNDYGGSDQYSYEDGPHAVTRAGGRRFEYDASGHLALDCVDTGNASECTDGRQYSYHAFQKVRAVSRGSAGSSEYAQSTFYYGAGRNRVIHGSVEGVESAKTLYIGNVEVYTNALGKTEFRRSIAGKVLVTVQASSGSSRSRYLHRDHLGSIVAMSDETGYVIARMSFDPWGKRRSPEFSSGQPSWMQWINGTAPAWMAQFGEATEYTPRGFTGHEHLDALGIVHMNGRIYDPHLARFLQADPFVEDSATMNRYTYSHNSPLVYYDPSGYTSFKDIAKTVVSVAISVYTGGAAASGQWALFGAGAETLNAVSTVMVGGALSGAVASGSWDGALWGAFSGAAFYGVGQWVSSASWSSGNFAGSGLSGAQFAVKSLGHGVTGGIVSDLRGGKFGHGFASSFVGAASHPYIANGFKGNNLARGTMAALVGGTASRLSGGKFANGAATAAMAFAFNSELSRDRMPEYGTKAWAERQAEMMNRAGGNWVADPIGNGQWNVKERSRAANEAAGLTTDETKSAGGGVSGQGFLGVIGTSVSARGAFSSTGQRCTVVEVCFQFGLGLSAGGGVSGNLTLDDLETGETFSLGIFAVGGKGMIGAGSLDLTSPGVNLDLKPIFGAGYSGGIQLCRTGTEC